MLSAEPWQKFFHEYFLPPLSDAGVGGGGQLSSPWLQRGDALPPAPLGVSCPRLDWAEQTLVSV